MIETVCGDTLTRFAHDSKFDAEITKSLSSPLFVTIALITISFPIIVSESSAALIDGADVDDPHDMMLNLIELSETSSSYAVMKSSSSSSSQSKYVVMSRSYFSLDNPSGISIKKLTVSLSPLSRSSIISY